MIRSKWKSFNIMLPLVFITNPGRGHLNVGQQDYRPLLKIIQYAFSKRSHTTHMTHSHMYKIILLTIAYLDIQRKWSNLSIHLELCFWSPD